MDLSKLALPKITELKELLNLNDEEMKVFDMLCKGRSIVEISMRLMISESTVSRRVRSIRKKMLDLGERV